MHFGVFQRDTWYVYCRVKFNFFVAQQTTLRLTQKPIEQGQRVSSTHIRPILKKPLKMSFKAKRPSIPLSSPLRSSSFSLFGDNMFNMVGDTNMTFGQSSVPWLLPTQWKIPHTASTHALTLHHILCVLEVRNGPASSIAYALRALIEEE